MGSVGTRRTVREIDVVCVRLPEVPVIVAVTVPVMAVALAVSVKVLVPMVGFGLNDAVTPLGKPEADKLTLPLKPFCGLTAIVLVPLVPCVMIKLLGEAESVKSGVGIGLTVSKTVVLFLKLPEIPVIVTVVVPVLAVLLAVSVKLLAPVVGFGLNDAATPFGKPEADRLTLPLKPFCGVTVIVLVPLVPCVIIMLLEDPASVKVGEEGVINDTLSKVAVARAVLLPLFTASPIYVLGPMLIVWPDPTCTQLAPSGDV